MKRSALLAQINLKHLLRIGVKDVRPIGVDQHPMCVFAVVGIAANVGAAVNQQYRLAGLCQLAGTHRARETRTHHQKVVSHHSLPNRRHARLKYNAIAPVTMHSTSNTSCAAPTAPPWLTSGNKTNKHSTEAKPKISVKGRFMP